MAAPAEDRNRSRRTERRCSVENKVYAVAWMEVYAGAQSSEAMDEQHVAEPIP